MLYLACVGAPYWVWAGKQQFLSCFFFDFLKEFVSDVQTFIEVKQYPQAGPETPHTMCEKFEDVWKNSIYDYFLNFSHGSTPPCLLITDM